MMIFSVQITHIRVRSMQDSRCSCSTRTCFSKGYNFLHKKLSTIGEAYSELSVLSVLSELSKRKIGCCDCLELRYVNCTGDSADYINIFVQYIAIFWQQSFRQILRAVVAKNEFKRLYNLMDCQFV